MRSLMYEFTHILTTPCIIRLLKTASPSLLVKYLLMFTFLINSHVYSIIIHICNMYISYFKLVCLLFFKYSLQEFLYGLNITNLSVIYFENIFLLCFIFTIFSVSVLFITEFSLLFMLSCLV